MGGLHSATKPGGAGHEAGIYFMNLGNGINIFTFAGQGAAGRFPVIFKTGTWFTCKRPQAGGINQRADEQI